MNSVAESTGQCPKHNNITLLAASSFEHYLYAGLIDAINGRNLDLFWSTVGLYSTALVIQ